MQLHPKKYDAFCSHIFDYARLRRKAYCIEEVRNYGKNCGRQKRC